LNAFESVVSFFQSPIFKFTIKFTIWFIFALWISLVFWTFRDADRRGTRSFLWAFIVLVFNFFGFLIYLIVRPPEFLDDVKERELELKEKEVLLRKEGTFCPNCSKLVEKDFLICPYCEEKLKMECPDCNSPLEKDWKACPYCKKIL
jgi:RNA polymerase subunit RPABC4/transcription elongation factor Spt4